MDSYSGMNCVGKRKKMLLFSVEYSWNSLTFSIEVVLIRKIRFWPKWSIFHPLDATKCICEYEPQYV